MVQVGSVHQYAYKKLAFEFNSKDTKHFAKNVVLFIGGLTDGLLTVHYLPKLAEKLSSLHDDWVLVQGILTSSYCGWGQSSLETDTKEMSQIISYLRSEAGGSREKIVLMGHSTGCQDTMTYLSKFMYLSDFNSSKDIDGAILQAPVSDREGVEHFTGKDKLDALVEEVQLEYISKGLGQQMLPLKFSEVSFGTPITAYRFNSLFLKYGDDDYFSSYISDDQLKLTFGKVKKPLLSLYGTHDEFVPKSVDRQKLVDRWQTVCDVKYWSKYSKLLAGASHTVEDSNAVEDMLDTIEKFIATL